MGRLGLAIKLFLRALRADDFAARAEALLADRPAPKPVETKPAAPPIVVAPPAPAAPSQSDAVLLLSILQREARLVDFLKEDIAAYANDQIGAAVRDVHRDAAAALERLFAIRPLSNETEGARTTIATGYDAGRVRLTGNVTGQPPHNGAVRHAGWIATQNQLPKWTGSADAAKVVAPMEVEIQ